MIDFGALGSAVQAHTSVVRILIADAKGSTPREAGTSMLVWADGIDGTIGGGRLEYQAIETARTMLTGDHTTSVRREALGPGLGQCCGGAVTLVYEWFDVAKLRTSKAAADTLGRFTRRVEGESTQPTKIHHNLAARAETNGRPVPVKLSDGWLTEPVWQMRQPVYIYGAGHVGRALSAVLAPMPRFEVVLADPRDDQYAGVDPRVQQRRDLASTEVMASAPDHAAHFIMTPDHELDLELCHRLLTRRFHYAGLIGSETKWARFRSRLASLGHSAEQIDRIQCPIGDVRLGKHPHAIAVGVAASLLRLKLPDLERQRSLA